MVICNVDSHQHEVFDNSGQEERHQCKYGGTSMEDYRSCPDLNQCLMIQEV